MITFDTNLLVRLLVEDDPLQAEKARGALRAAIEQGQRCLVTIPALCELLWVLRRAYKVPRTELAEVVQNFLDDDRYEVENRSSVAQSLDRFRAGKGDFADYLIGIRGQAHGSTLVLTFDRGLLNEDGFQVL